MLKKQKLILFSTAVGPFGHYDCLNHCRLLLIWTVDIYSIYRHRHEALEREYTEYTRECNDYSYDPGDPWDGVFRVWPLGTQKNDELRRVVEHHLRISQQVRSQSPEYHVCCHHWNRKLIMELLKPDPSNHCCISQGLPPSMPLKVCYTSNVITSYMRLQRKLVCPPEL